MPRAPRASGPARRWIVVALVPMTLFVATGVRGIDFGFHWDEGYHVGNLRDALDSGTLLPAGFRYPSLSHWLCLAALAPEAIAGRGAA
ncbi:MAG: hypothetical protein ABFS46_15805, partial [Myxococcota bacterium]